MYWRSSGSFRIATLNCYLQYYNHILQGRGWNWRGDSGIHLCIRIEHIMVKVRKSICFLKLDLLPTCGRGRKRHFELQIGFLFVNLELKLGFMYVVAFHQYRQKCNDKLPHFCGSGGKVPTRRHLTGKAKSVHYGLQTGRFWWILILN